MIRKKRIKSPKPPGHTIQMGNVDFETNEGVPQRNGDIGEKVNASALEARMFLSDEMERRGEGEGRRERREELIRGGAFHAQQDHQLRTSVWM